MRCKNGPTMQLTPTKHFGRRKMPLAAERDSLKPELDKSAIPNERVEATYLNIIGAMLDPMLEESA